MPKATLLLVLLGLSGPVSAQGQNMDSANYMLPHCREWLQGNRNVMSGVCMGIVAGAISYAAVIEKQFRFCPPDGLTRDQAVAIVVKFVNARPEQWHEDFAALALLGLQRARALDRQGLALRENVG